MFRSTPNCRQVGNQDLTLSERLNGFPHKAFVHRVHILGVELAQAQTRGPSGGAVWVALPYRGLVLRLRRAGYAAGRDY
jgi:hypothetical protein